MTGVNVDTAAFDKKLGRRGFRALILVVHSVQRVDINSSSERHIRKCSSRLGLYDTAPQRYHLPATMGEQVTRLDSIEDEAGPSARPLGRSVSH